MDSGLKKLWIRRKSKGADGMLDSGVGSLRKSQSTDQTGWSVNGSPRSTHARGSSLDYGSRHVTPNSTVTSPLRPTSSSRKVPVLVGVSRPSTAASRPGTSESGSLMNAVTRAATDAVTRAEQEYNRSAEYYTKNNRRQKAPRYIDIFSISSVNGSSPKTGYNEDVAERNLDLARVALEGNQYHSSPSSKYAEEVALRNAYPPLPSRGSQGTSLASPRQNFDDMQTALSEYTSSRMSDQSPVFGRVEEAESHIHNSTDAYCRVPNGQTWEARPQSHESSARIYEAGRALSGQNPRHKESVPQDIAERTVAVRSPDHFPRHQEPGDLLRQYQLSPTEIMPNRYSDRPQSSRPIASTSASRPNTTHRTDYSVRSPSSLSNTSSVRRAINLPHRMIMDLTGDDSEVFSEASAASAYSSSPVVEQAKFDTMRKINGGMIASPSPEAHRDAPRTSSLLSDQVSSSAETAPSQPQTDVVSQSSASQPPPRNNLPTFSPVSTVASLPPRASVWLETPTKSNAAGTIEVLSDGPKPTGETAPQDQNQQQLLYSDHHEPHKQAVVRQEEPSTESMPNSTSQKEAVKEGILAERGPDGNGRVEVRQTDGASVPTGWESVQPTTRRSDAHEAAENLHSIGFVDTSRVSGVTARDFASTIAKSPPTRASQTTVLNREDKPKSIVNNRNRSASHDPSSGRNSVRSPLPHKRSVYQSTFDESEFAQKQAEARAALIRLQESLNENFLSTPSPSPLVQTSRTNVPKHNFSFSDGKPVAPSTIFAQVRNSSPVQPGDEMPEEEDKSKASYHSLTTVSDGEKTRNGHSHAASAAPNAQGQSSRSKGSEMDGDGPGPSIVDTEMLNKPLPMPPPLHVNGFRLNKQQQQVPPSPGEVSLSSFPIPVSSPRQSQASSSRQRANSADPQSSQSGSTSQSQYRPHHSHQSSSGGASRMLRRQSSQRSQASSASAFSIPFHMIPDRSSSIRDRSVMEESE